MKKIFNVMVLAAMAAAPLLTSCGNNDDDINKLKEDMTNVTSRVTSLENVISTANNNIGTLQGLVDAISKAEYVTSVAQSADGYTLTFSSGNAITVKDGKNGENGQDGHNPIVGVKQDTDGIWYWTLDGEWLKDATGAKVRADGAKGDKGDQGDRGEKGEQGVTPKLRINDASNEWEISLDEGKTWTSTGVKATGASGDTFFKSVTAGEDKVTIVLAGDVTLELPLFDSFKKVRDRVQSIVYVPDFFDGKIGVVENDKAQTITYQVKPAAVATYLADHPEAMQFVGEDVNMTRATEAALAIGEVEHDGDGLLKISATPTGFAPAAGYAFALDIEADGSSYRTAYTPTFLIVNAERIALGINGLYPGMGVVTTGQYLQCFVVFFPDTTTSRGITWTSSDETRGTVNRTGVVAVAENASNGEFTITATTTNGKKASLTFKIVDGKLQIDTDQLKQSMAQ